MIALLIEVVSIQVAGKQIKKPIDIPRPGKKKSRSTDRSTPRREPPAVPVGREVQESPVKATPALSDAERDAAFKQGVGVLMGSRRVRGR